MRPVVTLSLWALGLLLAGTGAVSSASAGRPAPPEAVVSIPRGATLEEALAAVRAATGGVVLAELPAVPRRLETAVVAAPLGRALGEISLAYHLHYARRGNLLLFGRRLRDPRETLRLEIPEITAILRDLDALAGQPLRGVPDTFLGPDMRRFYRELSPEQVRAMRGAGLPFSGLTREQQARWMRMAVIQGYRDPAFELSSGSQMFAGWSRCRLVVREEERQAGPVPLTCLEYPRTETSRGVAYFPLAGSTEESSDRDPGVEPGISGETWPPAAPRHRGIFGARVRLAPGVVALPELTAAVAAAAGARIDVPGYARARRLWAGVDGAPAGDVVQGLETLYAWRLTPAARDRYALGRPGFQPGRDLRELHARARAAVPLTALLSVTDPRHRDARRHRRKLETPAILGAVAKERGRNWAPVRVTELSPPLQQRLANALFDYWLQTAWSFVGRAEPSWDLASPREGVFTLRGEGTRPLLNFLVTRWQGRRYSQQGWGWNVETDRLYD